MRNDNLLSAENTLLMVIDIQEAFIPHIRNIKRVIRQSLLMVKAAPLLNIPMVVTEQYPKGLGRTTPELLDELGEHKIYDKVSFSCCGDDNIRKAIEETRCKQVLLVGIETHVCVAQTALDLQQIGLQPYVAVDAVSARRKRDADISLQRMRDQQVNLTTTEAAIMEMTVSSKHPSFRMISKLIK